MHQSFPCCRTTIDKAEHDDMDHIQQAVSIFVALPIWPPVCLHMSLVTISVLLLRTVLQSARRIWVQVYATLEEDIGVLETSKQ